MDILSKEFFINDASVVAKELLGKILVRKFNGHLLSGKIVETEAYFGEKDPASRAYKGYNNFAKLMWDEPGKVFIYMVHANWLFNIVTMPKNIPSAVLIRAIEPLDGLDVMKTQRKIHGFQLTNGPGKLTQALMITKDFNNTDITQDNNLSILDNQELVKIVSSNRVGVTKDLRRKLRFYVKGSKFVSKL